VLEDSSAAHYPSGQLGPNADQREADNVYPSLEMSLQSFRPFAAANEGRLLWTAPPCTRVSRCWVGGWLGQRVHFNAAKRVPTVDHYPQYRHSPRRLGISLPSHLAAAHQRDLVPE
jgi:hypothetical protein